MSREMMRDEHHDPDALAGWVHWSLMIGLVMSGAMLMVGLIAVLARHEPRPNDRPPALPAIIQRATAGQGVALLNMGVLLLMATPVARVIVLAVGWTVRRDYRMAAVALCVLALLAISLFIGAG